MAQPFNNSSQSQLNTQQKTTNFAQQSTSLTTYNKSNESQMIQQQSRTNYFQNLLGKYSNKADYVQSFTRSKQQEFHEEIINGRYNIKQRQWSPQEEKIKSSKNDIHKNTGEMVYAKKQLEEQLQFIEGELQQNQEKAAREMTQDQRITFLKRIEKQKKQLHKKKQENSKLMQEKRLQQQRKQKQLIQRQENQRKLKKQQQIAQRMKNLEQVRKKKEQEYKNQSIALKQKMKQKTTADKIEEHYLNIQNESLQERKKRLAEIRMLHKPIDKKQLDAHSQKLQQFHAERLAALAAAAAEKNNNDKSAVAFYKSIFYKKVKEEQKIFVDKKNQDELGKLRQNRDKLKKFSEQIRQNYKPIIDEKKVEEMKFRSVNIRNRSMSSVRANKNQSAQKIGLRYLQFSKMQVDHQKMLVSGDKTEQQQEEKPKKQDYLAQMRSKNKNRASESAHELLNKLDRGSLSKEDKAKKILQFTDKIEKTAKRKQQLSKIGSSVVDGELDALYLQAIEAKLGLLQDY